MTACDRCGDDVNGTITINHIHFDKSPIQHSHSTYTVCRPCHDELEDDPDVHW